MPACHKLWQPAQVLDSKMMIILVFSPGFCECNGYLHHDIEAGGTQVIGECKQEWHTCGGLGIWYSQFFLEPCILAFPVLESLAACQVLCGSRELVPWCQTKHFWLPIQVSFSLLGICIWDQISVEQIWRIINDDSSSNAVCALLAVLFLWMKILQCQQNGAVSGSTLHPSNVQNSMSSIWVFYSSSSRLVDFTLQTLKLPK